MFKKHECHLLQSIAFKSKSKQHTLVIVLGTVMHIGIKPVNIWSHAD